MKISLVEIEPEEEHFFRQELASHDLDFPYSLDEVSPDTEVLSIFIYSRIDAAFLDKHPKLKLIASRSTGVDHIDLEVCGRRNVLVNNVTQYGETTVAEHTFALILALSRRLHEARNAQKMPRFLHEALRGFDLYGKTLGVIGAGRIGVQVIRIALGFGMNPIAYDLQQRPLMAEVTGFKYVGLKQLLAESHIVTLHVPLTPETRHLINRETIAKCRRGVYIINTSRGGLIDTSALLEALESRAVRGAGLDVLELESVMKREGSRILSDQIVDRLQNYCSSTEAVFQNPERVHEIQELMHSSALLSRPDVVFTPHIAFNSTESVAGINQATVRNIRAFAAGHPIKSLIASPGE